MKTIHLICAARPNFMKVAPLYHALKKNGQFIPKIVHTGQHYDYQMSQVFLEELGLSTPDYYLNIGSGTHAEQTAGVMMAYEKLCLANSPNLVVVVGDVNSTMAAAITAKKCDLPLAHLEAGLRSFDRTMPEEINRLVTDAISDFLWTPSIDADVNLLNEGISKKIDCVGNIMIDSYKMLENKIKKMSLYKQFGFSPKSYGVITLHRPSNVDNVDRFNQILKIFQSIDIPCVFPVHPRTLEKISKNNALLLKDKKGRAHIGNVILIDPLSYIEFMSLVNDAKWVLTDSGGVQEETTYLGISCYTLRNNTERPITVTEGSNQLVTLDNVLEKLQTPKEGRVPKFWDGNTAARIIDTLERYSI